MAPPRNIASSLPAVADDEEIDPVVLEAEEEALVDEPETLVDAGEAEAGEQAAVEAEARRAGWRPLEEYRGKPGGWVDAKAFLERGETFMPFLQADRRRLREENERMASEVQQMRQAQERTVAEVEQMRRELAKSLDFARKANKAGYDKAVADIEAQRRAAVANGDVQTYDQLGEQLSAMEEAREEVIRPDEAPPQLRQPAPSALAPEYETFLAANPWAATDRILNPAMIAAHNQIMEESPGLGLAQQLEAAKEIVMAQYPRKFGLPEGGKTQAVAAAPARKPPAGAPLAPRGGQPPARQATGINAIADPTERAQARAGFNAAKQTMPDVTEAEYLEIFYDPHADVVDVMGRHKTSKQEKRANARRP